MAEGGQAAPTHKWWKEGRDRQAVQREDMGMCALKEHCLRHRRFGTVCKRCAWAA